MKTGTAELDDNYLEEVMSGAGHEPEAEGEPEPASADKGKDDKGKGKGDDAAAELRRELKAERKAREESEANARYWHEQAKGGTKGKKDEPEEEPEEEDEDLLEVLTNEGTKGFKRLAQKYGFVSKKEVEARIESERATAEEQAKLLRRYPDLDDQDSEFFQKTAQNYQELQSMGIKGNVLEAAAKMTAKELGVEASKGKAAPSRRRDDDDDDEAESDRVRRAQGAGSGRRQPTRRAADDGDPDELSPLQRSIAARLGVSDDAYRKRAKAGVSMSGMPVRGRR